MQKTFCRGNEKRNFIRYLSRHPLCLFYIIPFLARIIKRKLLSRVNNVHLYPYNIRRQYNELIKSDLPYNKRKKNDPDDVSPDFDENEIDSKLNTFVLAGSEYTFGDLPDWSIEFYDYEQTVSLHRWNWLLTTVTLEPDKQTGPWGLRLISDWISKASMDKKSIVWDPYNTSERISNSILFFYITHQKNIPRKIIKSIKEMTLHVIRKLEYLPYDHMSNHVLNNARAIYLSGSYFQNKSLADFAKNIIRSEVYKVINKEGFLNEGSSHYHFLITRWFLEMYHFSKISSDDFFCDELRKLLVPMLNACWFFLVFNKNRLDFSIPLIGDVSPDFTPEWLLGVPWSSDAIEIHIPAKIPSRIKRCGWFNLFPTQKQNFITLDDYAGHNENRFTPYPDSGWFRLDLRKATLFWHIEPEGSPPFSSHSHCDTGSFVLFLNGESIIVDPGRFSYVNGEEGVYGMLASAHNQVIIDGLDAFIYFDRTHYPDFYRRSIPEYRYAWTDHGFEFCVRHKGFERVYNDKILFERTFKILESSLIIEDVISGVNEHQITSFFHFAPGIDVKDEGSDQFLISGPEEFERLIFSINPFNDTVLTQKQNPVRYFGVEIVNDFYCPSYGKKEKSKTIVITSTQKLPLKNTYILSW